MDILTELNPAQKEAVESVNGPVLILAGPGSGKTRVITHRVAYLINTCHINPRNIMAVTFTNKASRDMEERLQRLISSTAGELTIGTFHAICARMLRRDGTAIGVDPRFVIYGRDDQLSLMKRAIQETGFDPKQYVPEAITSAISAAKSQLLTPLEFTQRGHSYFDEVVARVYECYQRLLAENNALDFDDLLMKTVQLLQKSPQILAHYQTRYRHILVDEFQDTNLVQYELIRLLGDKYRNICVVGDPDQSIYSWRFADLRNILSFEKDYPDTKLILLEENYRSTKMILETASSVISANNMRKPRDLWTNNDTGEPVAIVETYTEQEEAQFVVSEIERLIDRGEYRFADCAVMYRTNAQSRALEEAFIRYGTPHKLVAGTRFYERREVKDIIAYLRLTQNPNDSISLNRVINVPQRGVGQQTQTRLSEWAKSMDLSPYEALQLIAHAEDTETTPPLFNSRTTRILTDYLKMVEEFTTRSSALDTVELFDLIVERAGYKDYIFNGTDGEERWDNVMELRTVAQRYSYLEPEEGLTAFLEGVTLVSDVDGLNESVPAVTLITLHQAKGLEYPIVFIVGMDDGLLPHSRSFDDPAQMEEERRLCYVGITRAKKKVYLVRAFRRNIMGRSMVCEPSRFLSDIPKQQVAGNGLWPREDTQIAPSVYSWNKAPSSQPPATELKDGDYVRHTQFGEGIVVSYRPLKDDAEVVVAFNGGVKKLLLSFACLERIEQR